MIEFSTILNEKLSVESDIDIMFRRFEKVEMLPIAYDPLKHYHKSFREAAEGTMNPYFLQLAAIAENYFDFGLVLQMDKPDNIIDDDTGLTMIEIGAIEGKRSRVFHRLSIVVHAKVNVEKKYVFTGQHPTIYYFNSPVFISADEVSTQKDGLVELWKNISLTRQQLLPKLKEAYALASKHTKSLAHE